MDSRKFVLRNFWWQRLLIGGKLIDFVSCSCVLMVVVLILGM